MPEPPERGRIEVIAHRGYSAVAPENTMVAVEAAIAAGADAVEFDLHVTRDGVPVLFHDATLDRTTNGTGPLEERSFDELRRLDAGSWFGDDFVGEPIPTFSDAMVRIGARLGRIYPEVKMHGGEGALELMADLVTEAQAIERTVFISMDWEALDTLRSRRADVRVGYIVEERRRAREGLARADGDPRALLDFRARILLDDPRLAQRAQERGIDLAVWTVDDPAQAAALLDVGVRRFTTNRVAELIAWRASL